MRAASGDHKMVRAMAPMWGPVAAERQREKWPFHIARRTVAQPIISAHGYRMVDAGRPAAKTCVTVSGTSRCRPAESITARTAEPLGAQVLLSAT